MTSAIGVAAGLILVAVILTSASGEALLAVCALAGETGHR